MDAQLNCATCGEKFHQYSLKQKYCSATCRNKATYANRKRQLAKVEQLFSIAEELARSEERVKQLEAQLKGRKEENEALRAHSTIDNAANAIALSYRISQNV